MGLASSSLGAAGVAAIYVIYGAFADWRAWRVRRAKAIRKRVAFLLWKAACQVEASPSDDGR